MSSCVWCMPQNLKESPSYSLFGYLEYQSPFNNSFLTFPDFLECLLIREAPSWLHYLPLSHTPNRFYCSLYCLSIIRHYSFAFLLIILLSTFLYNTRSKGLCLFFLLHDSSTWNRAWHSMLTNYMYINDWILSGSYLLHNLIFISSIRNEN